MSPGPAEQSISSLHSAALSQEASCKSKIIGQRELLVWVRECKARPVCFSSRSLSTSKTTKGVPEFLCLVKTFWSGSYLSCLIGKFGPIPLLLLVSEKEAGDSPLCSARRGSLVPVTPLPPLAEPFLGGILASDLEVSSVLVSTLTVLPRGMSNAWDQHRSHLTFWFCLFYFFFL